MSRALTTRQGSLLAPQLDYILLDGSGSMAAKWHDTCAALQAFLACLQAENIHSHGILHTFDSQNIELLQRDDTIAKWESCVQPSLCLPGGGTPLYDAVNVMVRRLADLDPPRCSIIIVTDGLDTGDKYTTEEQARNLLDWCRAKGWQVTFLGADFSNAAQAKALGADKSNSIGVQQKRLEEAGRLLGEKRVRNAQSGADINFSEDEQTDFGGYLNPPSGSGSGKSPWEG